MSTTYTANLHLQKPSTADRYWDLPLNSNTDLLDGMTAIGGLATTSTETPSTTLNVAVSQGTFRKGNGTIGIFAGASSVAIPPSAASCLWLTDDGILTAGPAFPSTVHIRLASVLSGSGALIRVTDQRVQCDASGAGLGFVLKAGDTLSDGATIALGTSLGTKLGTSADQKLGFFGSPPAPQAASVAVLTDTTSGTVGGGVTNVGTTFNPAVINSNLATLAATVNALIGAMKHNGLMAT